MYVIIFISYFIDNKYLLIARSLKERFRYTD
jgi:hypothetical protein